MPGTILCVDDDRNLCQILAKSLAGEGYRVLTAFDGDQAVEILREGEPDLVLLDLILPRRDGFAVLEALRAMPAPMRDTAAVVLSGCTPTEEYRTRAASLGALEVIQKPVPLDRLLALVGERVKPQAMTGRKARTSSKPLTGSLKSVPFPALLHHLHGLRATGVLHLVAGKKRKWIEIRDGHPVAVRSNLVNECLGNFLVRTGRLSQAVVAESRRRMRTGKLQGEVLVAMDLLSDEELAASLRAQADEKLFEIFSWNAGSFRFEKGGRLQRANMLGVERSPANLILQGVRKRFSGERVEAFLKKHGESYPAPAASPYYRFQEIELSPREEVLLSGLDGTRRLRHVQKSEPDLARTLYALVATGLLELRGGAPRVSQPVVRQAAPPADDEHKRAELSSLAEGFRVRNHFEVLGVDENVGEDEIRTAYENLVERSHPDRFQSHSDAVKSLAREVFRRATDAYETLSDPRRRGEYVLKRRRHEREAAELEEGRNAVRAEAEFQKAEGLMAQRAYEAALVCFGRALELYPEEGEYHAHYGMALHLCHPGEAMIAEEAIEHVKRGLKLASHREKPYLFLGRLYKAIGRVRQAERMFARAAQLGPDCVEALRELRLINMRREKSKGFIGRLLRR